VPSVGVDVSSPTAKICADIGETLQKKTKARMKVREEIAFLAKRAIKTSQSFAHSYAESIQAGVAARWQKGKKLRRESLRDSLRSNSFR
jgi:hypothetical protein